MLILYNTKMVTLENKSENLLKELQNVEYSIYLANNEFDAMFDKIVNPFIHKHNMLEELRSQQGKESFVQFMKSVSKSYINMINSRKVLHDKINNI
jgi:hypothetical protein